MIFKAIRSPREYVHIKAPGQSAGGTPILITLREEEPRDL